MSSAHQQPPQHLHQHQPSQSLEEDEISLIVRQRKKEHFKRVSFFVVVRRLSWSFVQNRMDLRRLNSLREGRDIGAFPGFD